MGLCVLTLNKTSMPPLQQKPEGVKYIFFNNVLLKFLNYLLTSLLWKRNIIIFFEVVQSVKWGMLGLNSDGQMRESR